ncbi:MAG TPA: deoxynucleoside kinase [Deinococcales bacterium]|nr:deoxynucleoside kinase [Deinococcales bacterium]
MYLAISGNIGSGKSSLTALLSERYALTPVYEAVDENPYLDDFYRDMGRYAFNSQVFFLGKRLEQHLTQVNNAERVIQDRTVFEDAAIFARNLHASGHIDERDWGTYRALYHGIIPALRAPTLLVYLRCSLPTLRAHIRKRGRDFEQSIPDDYLLRLNSLYEEWVGGYDLSPVVTIPGDDLDFVSSGDAFGRICAELEAYGLDQPVLVGA